MKNIFSAGLFRRIVAAFLDAVMVLFVYFFLVTYVATPIAVKTTRYRQDALDVYQYEVSSHLYVWMQQQDDGNFHPIEVKDYSEKIDSSKEQSIFEVRNVQDFNLNDFIRHAQYYYTVYLTGDMSRVEIPNDTATNKYDKKDFISPHCSEPIEGKLPIEIYTPVYFNTQIMGLGKEGEENKSPYFEYPIVEGVIDYSGLPVLKSGADETKAKEFTAKVLYDATDVFYHSDYMTKLNNDIKSIQLWSYIPTYIFSVGIFYLMIPLLSRGGRTLGKMTLGISLVGKTGYEAKKRQILFRQLVWIAEISFSLFIVGFGLTSFATLGIGCVIMLVVALFTKDNRAPHDLAALTIVLEDKKSIFFKDASEEDYYEKQVQDNIDKLHTYEPENKNIIQVGSEIIDPKIKEEIKKNSQKNKK